MATNKPNPGIVAITEKDKNMDGLFIMERAIKEEPPTEEQIATDKIKAEYANKYPHLFPYQANK